MKKSVMALANELFKHKIAPLTTHNNSIGGRFEILRPGVIQGHWHEDGNTYEITCPPQLQDSLLLLLQNCGDLEFKGGDA